MRIRETLRKRIAFWNEKGKEATEREDQVEAIMCMERAKELRWMLTQLRK